MNTSDVGLLYIQEHWDSFLSGLKEFVAIPSISTLPEYKGEVLHRSMVGKLF